MADNTQLNAGTGGDVIASDDVAGVKFQRVKLALGADGAHDGDVSSSTPMPTNPSDRAARDCGKVDIANLDTLPTFDLDSGAGTSNGQGIAIAVAASGGPVAITGDTENGLDVDVTRLPSIPAGTNNIGDVDVLSLPSIPAGTNNIGDVDVLSLPAIPAGSNKIGAVDLDSDATTGAAVPAVAQFVAGTDGTNARALKTDTSGELQVDVLTLPAIPAGNNNIGDVDIASLPADVALADDAVFTPATTKVIPAGFFADETSPDSVNEGDIGAARMTLDRKILTVQHAHTNGGWTPYKLISAATTNATSVKASAGQVGYAMVTNTNAAARFLKLYNKASAPTVGTDTPVHTFLIPGNTSGFTINFGLGVEFTTGIAFALTTGVADSDTAAVAANEIIVNLGYK